VLDSSTNAIVQNITVAGGPDKVSFTQLYAYIRAAGSEEVSMIRLSTVEGGKEPAISRFPGGQTAPEYASGPAIPAAIVPAPEEGTVLVSNPADKTIYYYSEGMAAPMGSFQNYRREALGVLAVNRNLRETKPGVYATTVRLAKGGRFDVPFVLDSPRMTQCFDYTVALPSDLEKKEDPKATVKLERLFEPSASAGAPLNVRVRLVDGEGRPLPDVQDLRHGRPAARGRLLRLLRIEFAREDLPAVAALGGDRHGERLMKRAFMEQWTAAVSAADAHASRVRSGAGGTPAVRGGNRTRADPCGGFRRGEQIAEKLAIAEATAAITSA
jgi:hypothetical protein